MPLARPCLAAVPLQIRRQINASIRYHSNVASPNRASTNSSVSTDEVAHFSALASSWWDPHGSSRLLHLMNPLRHNFINSCRAASQPLESTASGASNSILHADEQPHRPAGLKYLDIGCGAGIFAESAARLAATESVTAIDPTPDVIRVAEAHKRIDPLLSQPGKLTYLNTSIEGLDEHLNGSRPSESGQLRQPEQQQGQSSGWADVVSVFEVVEHVRQPADFLERCKAHVRPGGWLVGSTISRTWTSWLTTKLVAEDLLRVVPRGTHDWAKYIRPDELRAWAAKQPGWGEWRVLGVVYVPGVGWREVRGGEEWGNYFFGLRRLE